MKTEQRVYIKGNLNRGNEVIKTLIDLGGRNICDCCGIYDSSYYYINPDGVIDYANTTDRSAAYPFLKEFYKEIQLPRWKPKHGDYYYFINYKGMAMRSTWVNSVNEDAMYEFGNCFRTKEEAEATRDKIKELLNNKA